MISEGLLTSKRRGIMKLVLFPQLDPHPEKTELVVNSYTLSCSYQNMLIDFVNETLC